MTAETPEQPKQVNLPRGHRVISAPSADEWNAWTDEQRDAFATLAWERLTGLKAATGSGNPTGEGPPRPEEKP